MKQHADDFGLAAMCRMLGVHRSGYYAWLKEPASAREKDNRRLLGLIKHSWLESGSVYGVGPSKLGSAGQLPIGRS
jgi:putative transposase